MSKKRTIHGIDPYAPGGIDALLAHHRLTFGDAVMEAGAGDGAAAGGADKGDGGTEGQPGEQKPAGGQQEAKPAEWDGKVESLPADAQRIIADLRKEAGDERVAAKTLAAIQQALNPDAKAGEKPDADALTKALAERDADAKQAKIDLAVYKAANRAGADEDLLDAVLSRKGSLRELDPSDKDFTKKLDAVVKAELDANPKLRKVQAAGASGADFSGGSGESASSAASKARPGQPRLAAAYASK